MQTSRARPRLNRGLLIAAIVAVLGPADTAWAQGQQKQVLVVYSTRRDAEIVTVGDRELPRILEHGLAGGLDYYSEFIDQSRFSDLKYQVAFRDFLRLKYSGHQFDLVITIGDVPLDFIATNREVLFTHAPIVFFASGRSPHRPENATGVTAELNLSDTLAMAAELQPDVRNVFVVSGAGQQNMAFVTGAREQLRAFESRFTITYLSGLVTKDLEARLASLPAHSIVYYLLVDQDGSDEYFHPLEYLDRVVAAANAPVYCWVDSAMDRGILGGSLKDQRAQMEAVGAVALRVLRGERADSIPVSAPNLNIRQVDWRQLQRWGISESRVPAGALVKFRQPSVWDRYEGYILAAATVLLAQSVLIAGLLLQRSRRRQAEQQVRKSQVALGTSYERIRDLGGRLLHAQEAERSRIARELHDDIGQQMAVLEIDLELMCAALDGEARTLAYESLVRAHGAARSVHDLSHRLHPAKLRLVGLVGVLEGLQRELSQSPLLITFVHAGVPSTLPSDVTVCLYRIVQEAIQNAQKYSRARRLSVELRAATGSLALTITDDGVGFDVDAEWGKGLGLISMGERAEAIGGTFEIHSTPGGGTRLVVMVPLPVTSSGSDSGNGAQEELPRATGAESA